MALNELEKELGSSANVAVKAAAEVMAAAVEEAHVANEGRASDGDLGGEHGTSLGQSDGGHGEDRENAQ